MSTIVHYECRNLNHLRTGSRHGKGGLVIHHGTVGYCDGLHVEGAHRWVATGGVPIEYLVATAAAPDPGRIARTMELSSMSVPTVPPHA